MKPKTYKAMATNKEKKSAEVKEEKPAKKKSTTLKSTGLAHPGGTPIKR